MSTGLVSIGHLGRILTLIERIIESDGEGLHQSAIIDAGVIEERQLPSILEGGIRFKWLECEDEIVRCSNRSHIRQFENRIWTLRGMFLHMVRIEIPAWVYQLRKGVVGINNLADSECDQWFRDYQLDLTDEGNFHDENAKSWWSEMQQFAWEKWNIRLNELRTRHGITGEELSCEFEEERTGLKPIHYSRIDSDAGYDINSIRTEEDKVEIQIEVKASTMGFVYITRNEIRVCEANMETYCFHFWRLDRSDSKKSELGIFSAEEVLQHIPENQGSGSWVDVEIPISAFPRERFECPFDR